MANLSLPQDPTPEELRAQQRQDQQELAALGDDNDLPLPERDTDDLDDDDDLEGDRPEGEGDRKLSPAERQAAQMEELAKRRREHVQKEIDTPDVDDNNDSAVQLEQVQQDTAPETGVAQEVQTQASQQQDVAPGFYVNEKGEHRYREVAQNGTLIDVSATEAFQALAAENERLRKPQQPAVQQQPTNSQPVPADDAVNVELATLRQERRKEYAAMFNGDESAIDRLATLDDQINTLTVKQAQQASVQSIDQRAQQQRGVAWNEQVTRDEATLKADTKYSRVTQNPAAYDLVVQEAGRLMKSSDALNKGIAPIEIMRQAADKVMGIMGHTTPAAQSDARQQRKQEIGNTAVTAGAAPQQRQRTAQPDPVPDGGMSPQQQRRAAMMELRRTKGEKD